MDTEHTRKAYGESLAKLGEKRKDIIVLDADLSCSTKTAIFGKQFPDRFFNVGIAEQNMIDLAAGFALEGKTVFASTFSIFSIKAFEQMRNTIAHDNLNVKIVVTHGGISLGPDGSSHQTFEDIAITRVLPNMKVIVPADAPQTRRVIEKIAEEKGPFFVRLCRASTPKFFENGFDFKVGKADLVKEGKDVSLISTGVILAETLKAAQELERKGISTEVINMATVKPIDEKAIIKSALKTNAIVTAEEHSVIGGLGDAVADVLSRKRPTLLRKIGIKDRYGESGEYPDIWDKFGISAPFIVKAAEEIVGREVSEGDVSEILHRHSKY